MGKSGKITIADHSPWHIAVAQAHIDAVDDDGFDHADISIPLATLQPGTYSLADLKPITIPGVVSHTVVETSDEEEYDDVDVEKVDYIGQYTGDCPWSLEFLTQDIISETKSDGFWQTLWPHADQTTMDPVMEAADYYLLFGISNNSFVSFDEVSYPTDDELKTAGSLLGLSNNIIEARQAAVAKERLDNPAYLLSNYTEEARTMFVEQVERLDLIFKDYAHLACGGELRHHKAMKSSKFYKGSRRAAWAKWFYLYQHHGPESLVEMSKLFRQIKGNSIGGEAWAQASDILYARETFTLGPDQFTTKQLFVDRMFTLEHNNGSFLNKLNWINKRKGRKGADLPFGVMKDTVLAAHCASPADIHTLYLHASEPVQKLLHEYIETAQSESLEIAGKWGSDEAVKSAPVKQNVVEAQPVTLIDWSIPMEESTEESSTVNPCAVVGYIDEKEVTIEDILPFVEGAESHILGKSEIVGSAILFKLGKRDCAINIEWFDYYDAFVEYALDDPEDFTATTSHWPEYKTYVLANHKSIGPAEWS